MSISKEQFYEKLKKQLEETTVWPSEYMFKFILPSHQSSVEKLKDIFSEDHATIDTKSSSKGNYTSVTIRIDLDNPDQVVEKYKIVGYQIEGVISL